MSKNNDLNQEDELLKGFVEELENNLNFREHFQEQLMSGLKKAFDEKMGASISVEQLTKDIIGLTNDVSRLFKEIEELQESIEKELDRVLSSGMYSYDENHNVLYAQDESNKKMMSLAMRRFEINRLLSILRSKNIVEFNKVNELKMKLPLII